MKRVRNDFLQGRNVSQMSISFHLAIRFKHLNSPLEHVLLLDFFVWSILLPRITYPFVEVVTTSKIGFIAVCVLIDVWELFNGFLLWHLSTSPGKEFESGDIRNRIVSTALQLLDISLYISLLRCALTSLFLWLFLRFVRARLGFRSYRFSRAGLNNTSEHMRNINIHGPLNEDNKRITQQ